MNFSDRNVSDLDRKFMAAALRLALRGYGRTSPNPMVGALVVKDGVALGGGWHRQAGQPHAEIEAMRAAVTKGQDVRGATLYLTLEPCSTHGRTPPCTDAIIGHGIAEVVIGAEDPNPKHGGRAYDLLRCAGIRVVLGVCAEACSQLNESFNHWIVHQSPFVTVKAAMSLDGKIATAGGESKWITGPRARAFGMRLRRGADAILVGANTVVRDNPRLTLRRGLQPQRGQSLRRFILDARGRVAADARVFSDEGAELTTWVVGSEVTTRRIDEVAKRSRVLVAPAPEGKIDLAWVLARMGEEGIVNLLVEGGGEVNASFLMGRHAHRVCFFYAPMVVGGRQAPTGVDGAGAARLAEALPLHDLRLRRLGPDFLLTGLVRGSQPARNCF